jgi:hypothetical protein
METFRFNGTILLLPEPVVVDLLMEVGVAVVVF